jgi:predicted nuclease of restriction endonuclease-like (RecB) superfamily
MVLECCYQFRFITKSKRNVTGRPYRCCKLKHNEENKNVELKDIRCFKDRSECTYGRSAIAKQFYNRSVNIRG